VRNGYLHYVSEGCTVSKKLSCQHQNSLF
jgi:hypothetical protein